MFMAMVEFQLVPRGRREKERGRERGNTIPGPYGIHSIGAAA